MSQMNSSPSPAAASPTASPSGDDEMNVEKESLSKATADSFNSALSVASATSAAVLAPYSSSSSSSSNASSIASQYHSDFPAFLLSSLDPLATSANFSRELARCGLYGGAVSAIIPKRFADVSKYREVPDNQEVYADGSTDQSLIVEINKRQEVDDSGIAAFYFNDLASVNEATNAALLSIGQVDEKFLSGVSLPSSSSSSSSSPVSAFYAVGIQQVSKYRDSSALGNLISMHICVIRLKKIETDIAVILNAPIAFANEGSVAKDDVRVGDWREHAMIFYAALKSFTIHDWTLFK